MIFNEAGSILTSGQGHGPSRLMLTWEILRGPSKLKKGGWLISNPN